MNHLRLDVVAVDGVTVPIVRGTGRKGSRLKQGVV